MIINKNIIKKLFIGVVLFVLAGIATVAIRDVLARKNPEAALPEFKVFYSKYPVQADTAQADIRYTQLPVENTALGAFTWRFLFENVHGGQPDTWKELKAGWVNPGTAMKMEFSRQPQTIKAFRAYGTGGFEPLDGSWQLPNMPGTYTYRVEASWGTRGNIVVYFKVQVVSMA